MRVVSGGGRRRRRTHLKISFLIAARTESKSSRVWVCVYRYVCLCVGAAVWLCGCVAVWLCGCVAVRLCGCAAVWLCGCLAVCLCCCVVVWLCGCVGFRVLVGCLPLKMVAVYICYKELSGVVWGRRSSARPGTR